MKRVEKIAKELSYDCDGGKYCPACKHELRAPYFWFDHESRASNNIALLFVKHDSRLFEHLKDDLYDAFSLFAATGDQSKDAEQIEKWVMEWLGR